MTNSILLLAVVISLGLSVGCSRSEYSVPRNSAPIALQDGEVLASEADSGVSKDLASLAVKANRLVVTVDSRSDSPVLFESTEKADIESLVAALSVHKSAESVRCMCRGFPAISLFDGPDLLGQISNQHGERVRSSFWESDMPIVDSEKWLAWFDERGIHEPLLEYEKLVARRIAREKEEGLDASGSKQEDAVARLERIAREKERWMSAMPEGLAPAWQEAEDAGQDPERLHPLIVALDELVPGRRTQISALLNWYGAGAGPWSGHPPYESIVEELLLRYGLADVVATIDSEQVSLSQLEGAARLFSGSSFSEEWPSGLEELPDRLKEALWNQAKDTPYKGNLNRARRVFQ